MFKSLLLLVALSLQAASQSRTAILTGTVIAPAGMITTSKVQVVLFPPPYAGFWDAEAQRRVDSYWETYRQAFMREKELFIGVSRVAHREATEMVMTQMQRDSRIRMADFVSDTTAGGKFEFRNLQPGGYKIVALGQGGVEGPIWEATAELTDAIPQSVQLKLFP